MKNRHKKGIIVGGITLVIFIIICPFVPSENRIACVIVGFIGAIVVGSMIGFTKSSHTGNDD
jgi:FtsH-binding integral membrane protein